MSSGHPLVTPQAQEGKMWSTDPHPSYLLLPQARIWFFTVRTMEESMPQMTL